MLRWLVVLLAMIWWGVTSGSGAEGDWLGRSRDDVLAQLGSPVSQLQRGDTQVLMYPNSVRIEIRDEIVVGFRSGDGAIIVKSDGSRYTPTERGRVQRVAVESTAAAAAVDAPVEDPVVTAKAVPAEAQPALPAKLPAPDAALAAEENLEFEESSDEEDGAVDPNEAMKALEDFVTASTLPDSEEEPEAEAPAWARAVEYVITALLRFGFAVVMLRIAISWVELPCYMPDVLKVAALYTVIREGMHGLGELGGHWEWIRLFRLDDGVSFFALIFLLYQFKIALAGITALKIACVTKLVTYFLMLIAGIAISFGLGAL